MVGAGWLGGQVARRSPESCQIRSEALRATAAPRAGDILAAAGANNAAGWAQLRAVLV